MSVFATDVRGASETSLGNWIYPVNDIEALKTKLKWLLKLPDEESLRIGKENRVKIIRQFNLTKQAQKIKTL